MKILYCSAEMDPLAKVGGLADVAAALPPALQKRGHEVRVLVPVHESGEPAFAEAGEKFKMEVPCPAGGSAEVTIARLPGHGGPDVLLVRDGHYFPRPTVYGQPDDVLRYAFFCRTALELIRTTGWIPDIVHLNDWHTSSLAFALRNLAWGHPEYRRTASVLTIHNLRYRGPDDFTDELGMAIYYADAVTTVSPRYASEILGPGLGEGLDELLRLRADRLTGILNGLDNGTFDPAHDDRLVVKFSAATLPSRNANRAALRKELGIPGDGPLLSVVSRLTEQKGVDLIADAAPAIVRAGAQILVLGTGDPGLEARIRQLQEEFPGQVMLAARFDETTARRVYAGSDMLLMPSRFEPCGIGQMIAMRYGCVPVARRTGGLADTIRDPLHFGDRATGFLFDDFSVDGLMGAVRAALDAFHNREWWERIQRNGMAEPFSWDDSAARYEEVYAKALQRRH